MITDAFTHDNVTLKWTDYTYLFMILNRVKLERAVTFTKYISSVVSLIFLPQGLIWNEMVLPGGHPLSTYAKYSEQLAFFATMIRTTVWAYQGVNNVHFSKHFAYGLNGWSQA